MKINRGDFEGAAQEFMKWTKAGGRELPGLVKRRKDEQALFMRSK
jgi:lysozyme